jgi:hypothetical protein
VNFRVPSLAAGSYNAVVGWQPLGFVDRQSVPIWIGRP